uniref:SJCHGC04474 protein n=1 Tax=Schistosoma japonicum TaxID=6182 RepID=Q5DI02_SCHJA|nr:SJCHGC04474 protein [Schistosoma japonicum]
MMLFVVLPVSAPYNTLSRKINPHHIHIIMYDLLHIRMDSFHITSTKHGNTSTDFIFTYISMCTPTQTSHLLPIQHSNPSTTTRFTISIHNITALYQQPLSYNYSPTSHSSKSKRSYRNHSQNYRQPHPSIHSRHTFHRQTVVNQS